MSEFKLKVLTAQKEKYFKRIQRLYDLAMKVPSQDRTLIEQFEVLLQVFDDTIKEFENTEFRINEMRCELDESFVPEFHDVLPEMVGFIKLVAAREFPSRTTVGDASKSSGGKTSEMSSQVTVLEQEKSIQLPRIKIPSFSGRPDEWPVFYELFKTLVHDNERLSELEKLQYLVSKLQGPAASICKSLKPVSSNYSVIWKALFDRYNDDRGLADIYIDQIFGFKPLKSESREGLTMILDTFCSSMGSLK